MSVPLLAISLTADGAVSTTGTPEVAVVVDIDVGATLIVAAMGTIGFDAPGDTAEGSGGADCSFDAVMSVNPLQTPDPVPSAAAAVESEAPDASSGTVGLPISSKKKKMPKRVLFRNFFKGFF